MATVQAKTTAAARSEMKLAVLIGLATLVCSLLAWGYTWFMSNDASPERPIPAWLSISPVSAQTMDGRMLSIKINLEVKDKDALETLSPYEPAFKSLVAEVGSGFKVDEYRGSERIVHFGEDVLTSVNDYLEEQRVAARIKRVAFEEFRLMPS